MSLIQSLRVLAGHDVKWNGNNNIFLTFETCRIQVTKHKYFGQPYSYSYHVEGDRRVFRSPLHYLNANQLLEALNKLKEKK